MLAEAAAAASCSLFRYELDFSVESEAQADKIKQIMEQAVNLEVPNKVDYESGPNWGEIK